MIINDRMKVKSGAELAEFTGTGVKLTDGSEMEVDAVIFAYVPAQELSRIKLLKLPLI